MRKTGVGLLLGCSCAALSILLGCARVAVEAPKEPIKVDITMRLDIYQHVVKDLEAVDDIVYGPAEKQKAGDDRSFLNLFENAYAEESLGSEVEQAALKRKGRLPALTAWERKGVVGENLLGLVEIRNSSLATGEVEELVRQENADRMAIYNSLAARNNVTVEEVQKVNAQRQQEKAPSGTPIETKEGWKIK